MTITKDNFDCPDCNNFFSNVPTKDEKADMTKHLQNQETTNRWLRYLSSKKKCGETIEGNIVHVFPFLKLHLNSIDKNF